MPIKRNYLILIVHAKMSFAKNVSSNGENKIIFALFVEGLSSLKGNFRINFYISLIFILIK
jgi:hypothetical protein